MVVRIFLVCERSVASEAAADELVVSEQGGNKQGVAGAARDQELRDGASRRRRAADQEVGHDGQVDRPITVATDRIRVRAGLQQRLHREQVLAPRRVMKRRIAGLVRSRRQGRVSRNLGSNPLEIARVRGIDDDASSLCEPEPPREMAPQQGRDVFMFVILGEG